MLVTTDDDLAVGEFGIATASWQTRSAEAAPPPELPVEQPAQTMIYRAPPPVADIPEPNPSRTRRSRPSRSQAGSTPSRERASFSGVRVKQTSASPTSTSRKHAEVRHEEDAYWIVDLGSLNGTIVNGKRVDRQRLRDGDRITLGSTEIVFDAPLPGP